MTKKKSTPPSLVKQGKCPYLGTHYSVGWRRIPTARPVSGACINLFGDESTSSEYVIYALLILDELSTISLERQWTDIMSRYGSPNGTGFHARKLFNPHQRRKKMWMEALNSAAISELTFSLGQAIANSNALIYIGLVHKSTFPDVLPDGSGGEIKIMDHTLYPLAYLAAIKTARRDRIFETTLPTRLWVDQLDRVKIWGIGSIAINDLIKGSGLTPEPLALDKKPVLLEAADLVAYSIGRVLENEQSWLNPLVSRLNLSLTHYWWNPDKERHPNITQKMNSCAFLIREHFIL